MIDQFDNKDNFGKKTECGEYAHYILGICNLNIQYIDYILSHKSICRDIKISNVLDNESDYVSLNIEIRNKLMHYSNYLMSLNFFTIDDSYVETLEEITQYTNTTIVYTNYLVDYYNNQVTES